jgi:hypothetical protein
MAKGHPQSGPLQFEMRWWLTPVKAIPQIARSAAAFQLQHLLHAAAKRRRTSIHLLIETLCLFRIKPGSGCVPFFLVELARLFGCGHGLAKCQNVRITIAVLDRLAARKSSGDIPVVRLDHPDIQNALLHAPVLNLFHLPFAETLDDS